MSETIAEYDNKPIEELTFEQAFQELEKIINALETNENTLEDALGLYERGQALSRYCTELLDKAELRVREISGSEFKDF